MWCTPPLSWICQPLTRAPVIACLILLYPRGLFVQWRSPHLTMGGHHCLSESQQHYSLHLHVLQLIYFPLPHPTPDPCSSLSPFWKPWPALSPWWDVFLTHSAEGLGSKLSKGTFSLGLEWCVPVIPALGKPWKENIKFEAISSYTARPCL